jgi:hypothetical protein
MRAISKMVASLPLGSGSPYGNTAVAAKPILTIFRTTAKTRDLHLPLQQKSLALDVGRFGFTPTTLEFLLDTPTALDPNTLASISKKLRLVARSPNEYP